jgi:hypothetical protein
MNIPPKETFKFFLSFFYIFEQKTSMICFDFVNLCHYFQHLSILTLIKMISRIVTRSLLPLAQRCLATPYVLYTPRFNFARAPRIPSLKDAVETELKA